MPLIRITVGTFEFLARLEEADAPLTCAEFRKLLPYRQKLIHARWSGEAGWIPLGVCPIAMFSVSFRRLVRVLGLQQCSAGIPQITPAHGARACVVRAAKDPAANYTPWTTVCPRRALATSLLRRLKHLP